MKDIVLAVVKNSKDMVLLIQRAHLEVATDGSESRLEWAFPGGKSEEGETPEEAVAREVRQETGYNIVAKKLISQRTHPQFSVNISYYECELKDFSTKPTTDIHEVVRAKWINTNEIKEYITTDLDPKVAQFLGL